MAKKKNKKDTADGTSDPVEAVRAAIERTFHATSGGATGTTRQLLDEVTHAAARIRAVLEELRVLEDLKGLRTEIEALNRRVAALEAEAAKPTPRATTSRARSSGTTPRASGSRSSGTTRAKTSGTTRTTRSRSSGSST